MLTKQCARCKAIIPFGTTHCDQCRPLAEQQAAESKAKRTKQYNRKRNPIHDAFYRSKEWKALRYYKLKSIGYMCEDCISAKAVHAELATEVHHIQTLDEAWDKRLDLNNLRGLCTRHHNVTHGRFVSRPSQRSNKKD